LKPVEAMGTVTAPRAHHDVSRTDRLSIASASEHAISVREKAVSCRELTELYLGRIQKHNPSLHAIVISNEADAIRTACERDDDLTKDIVRGPLHGVPVTVKEAFDLTGLRTTVNFRPLRNNVAASDALIVNRLRRPARSASARPTSPRCWAITRVSGHSIRPRTIPMT